MIYPRFNVLRASLDINLLPSVSSFASDDNDEEKDDDVAGTTCHNFFFPTKRLLVPRTIQAMLIRKNVIPQEIRNFISFVTPRR